jgi:hypothetical protein
LFIVWASMWYRIRLRQQQKRISALIVLYGAIIQGNLMVWRGTKVRKKLERCLHVYIWGYL